MKDCVERVIGRNRLECFLSRMKVDEIAHRNELFRDPGVAIAMLQDHELICIRIWERTQEHRVDHREDSHVRSHSQGERQHGGDRERRVAEEEPERVSKIVAEHREHLRRGEPPAVEKKDKDAEVHQPVPVSQLLRLEIVDRGFEQILAQRAWEQ